MKTFLILFTVILGLALVASLACWRIKDRQLERQIQTLTDANNMLKQALGEMTIAITQKEKEIDELRSRAVPAEKEGALRGHL